MSVVVLDGLLAYAHHLCAFALLAVLFAEWCLTARDLDADGLRWLARLDLFYGLLAGLTLIAGVVRLLSGIKGWSFYAGNPLFWAKMGAFVLIGLCSIPPTLCLLHWRKDGRGLDAMQLLAVRRWMSAQLVLAVVVLLLAALMARGIGL